MVYRKRGAAATIKATGNESFAHIASDISLRIILSSSESDSDAFVPRDKKRPSSGDSTYSEDDDAAPKKAKASKSTKPRAKAAAGKKAKKPKRKPVPKKKQPTAKRGNDDDVLLGSGSNRETRKRRTRNNPSNTDSDCVPTKKAAPSEYSLVRQRIASRVQLHRTILESRGREMLF